MMFIPCKDCDKQRQWHALPKFFLPAFFLAYFDKLAGVDTVGLCKHPLLLVVHLPALAMSFLVPILFGQVLTCPFPTFGPIFFRIFGCPYLTRSMESSSFLIFCCRCVLPQFLVPFTLNSPVYLYKSILLLSHFLPHILPSFP